MRICSDRHPKAFEGASQAFQPLGAVADIGDVVGYGFSCSQTDADVCRTSISLVIADIGIARVIARTIVGGGDRLLEVGIGKRDDVPGRCTQGGKIQPPLEVGAQPGIGVGFYR